ncbi:hypothetical protein [Saccharothrix xinjiangensis]|uniref:NACHT domain-containing protein n=1 Tax=Saccharothrix xinjiangensis TaxID=204798 RepID=A0ABV9Y4D9_9PSEU
MTNNAGPVHGNLFQAGVIHGDVVLHHHLRVEPSDLERARLREEGWESPEQRLTDYLVAALRLAVEHPYPGVLPQTQPPPLSEVYLEQQATDELSAGIPAELVFRREDDCVVSGGPGAGKSSLLRMGVVKLVQSLAAGAEDAQVPVRILATDLLPDRPFAESLAAAIRADFGAGAMRGWSAGFFREPPIRGGRWLVMVDGLDEVSGVENRGRMLRQLSRIAHDHHDTHRLLVATRPMLEVDERQVRQWERTSFRLQEFRQHQLPVFAKAWFEALDLPDPQGLAARFTTSVERMSLGTLATTPLMATMLCQLFAARPDAKLPTTRREVYQRFTELLYSRVLSSTPPAQHADSVIRLREAHMRIARAIAKLRQEGETAATVDLLAQSTSAARPQDLPENRWRDLVYDVMLSTGLFAAHRDDLKFIHQTMTEFLAAEHVATSRRRSLRTHVELFGLTHNRNPVESSVRSRHSARTEWNNNSYIRFLLAAWLANGFPLTRPGLARVARRGGRDTLAGIRLFTDLAADGVDIGDRLRRHMTDSLRKLANDRNALFRDRCAAATLLWRHGDQHGKATLRRFASTGHRNIPDRVRAALALEEEGLPLLQAMLGEKHLPEDHLHVVDGLVAVDLTAAHSALHELLWRPGNSPQVRAKALVCLVRTGDPAGHRLAVAMFRDTVAAHAETLEALLELVRTAVDNPPVHGRLLRAVIAAADNRANSPGLRMDAADFLLSTRRRVALRCLVDMAKDQFVDPQWRIEAALRHAVVNSDRELSATLLVSVFKATHRRLDDDDRRRVESTLRTLDAADRISR